MKIHLNAASYSILGGSFCHRIRLPTRTFAPCFTILSDGLPTTYSCPFRRPFSLLHFGIFLPSRENPVKYNCYFAVEVQTLLNSFNRDAVVHFFFNGLMLKVPWKVRCISCVPWNIKIFLFHVPVSWYLRRSGNFRPRWQYGLSPPFQWNQSNCPVPFLT